MGTKPGEVECKQVAALARRERVQLIEDDIFDGAEQLRSAFVRQHERDLLRGGEQDIGRLEALTRAARGWRIAGACLEPDGQTHLPDGGGEVPRNVGRERLQGRHIKRVEASFAFLSRRGLSQVDKAR